jgi:hypothetical protein
MDCLECGKPVDLNPGDDITTNMGETLKLSPDEQPNLCRECMSKGWSPAKPTDFFNDPELRDRISILSPIQREDLDTDL